jgi:IS5 family transposase
MTSGRKYPAVT